MGKLLTATQLENYQRDGFHFPMRAYETEEMAEIRKKMEWGERQLGDGPFSGKYRGKCHLLFTFLDEMIRHPVILDGVEDILGPDILCWNAGFFTKEANSSDYVSWHQDATYWGLSTPEVVTAWVSFCDTNPASGNMRMAPGTHKVQHPHKDTFADENQLSRGQEVEVEVDESQCVDIVLKPGEFSLHHVLIVHASRQNTTNDRRIGFAIRYIKPSVQQAAGKADSAALVRGEDRYGNFYLEPRPERDLDPAMLKLHDDLSSEQAKILYRGTNVVTDAELETGESSPRRRI